MMCLRPVWCCFRPGTEECSAASGTGRWGGGGRTSWHGPCRSSVEISAPPATSAATTFAAPQATIGVSIEVTNSSYRKPRVALYHPNTHPAHATTVLTPLSNESSHLTLCLVSVSGLMACSSWPPKTTTLPPPATHLQLLLSRVLFTSA
eukprot:scaffold60660_cov59-Phaeocystis_antarctica.AAC.3